MLSVWSWGSAWDCDKLRMRGDGDSLFYTYTT